MSRSSEEALFKYQQKAANMVAKAPPPVVPVGLQAYPYNMTQPPVYNVPTPPYPVMYSSIPLPPIHPSTHSQYVDPILQYNGSIAHVQQYNTLGLIEGVSSNNEPERDLIPIHGNDTNFNINTLLHTTIMGSEYFQELFVQLETFENVIDEIYCGATHVEAWQTGTSRVPSSAFCLLVKLMMMRLTFKEMKRMLNTGDNSIVRAIGFLYLRYCSPPKDLWGWFEEYLEDEEEIYPSCDTNVIMTVGEYCIKLLTDMSYFGTTLNRIPIPIERKIKVMLLLLDEKKKRRKNNMRSLEQGCLKVGTKIKAIYSDEENEPSWYDAVLDYKDTKEENKYWVTFPEYGNKEKVDLGDMELFNKGSSSSKESSRSRSGDRNNDDRDRKYSYRGGRERSRSPDSRDGNRNRRSRSRSFDRDRNKDDSSTNLMDKVLKNARNASAAVGKNYGQRPASYKGSLALKVDRYTTRQKSRSRSPEYRDYRRSDRSKDRFDRKDKDVEPPSAMIRNELSRDQIEKMKKLKDRYGDASGK
jgi:pre-mRNA-splicing factor 38B